MWGSSAPGRKKHVERGAERGRASHRQNPNGLYAACRLPTTGTEMTGMVCLQCRLFKPD